MKVVKSRDSAASGICYWHISKVDQPTAWCAGMVIVPKKTGEVRVCVDLKPLNESVLQEVYPIPKVDDVLRKLAGATVYSMLDHTRNLHPSSLTLSRMVFWK